MDSDGVIARCPQDMNRIEETVFLLDLLRGMAHALVQCLQGILFWALLRSPAKSSTCGLSANPHRTLKP